MSESETPPVAPKAKTSADYEENVVPFGEKVAVGAGGLPFWMGNVVVQSTAQPFYVMMLAVNPASVWALFLFTKPRPCFSF